MKGCRPLTNDEVDIVAKSFGGRYGKRDKALFLLGVKSGFRISELLSIKVKDVRKNGKILERVNVDRKHMKRKFEGRTVLLHPQARMALEAWLAELDAAGVEDESFLFLSRKGGNHPISRTHAWRVLHESFEANELTGKLGTHSMRKSFASKIYEALNHDLVRTQKALGHRNINSTVSYLSFAEAEIDAAILTI